MTIVYLTVLIGVIGAMLNSKDTCCIIRDCTQNSEPIELKAMLAFDKIVRLVYGISSMVRLLSIIHVPILAEFVVSSLQGYTSSTDTLNWKYHHDEKVSHSGQRSEFDIEMTNPESTYRTSQQAKTRPITGFRMTPQMRFGAASRIKWQRVSTEDANALLSSE